MRQVDWRKLVNPGKERSCPADDCIHVSRCDSNAQSGFAGAARECRSLISSRFLAGFNPDAQNNPWSDRVLYNFAEEEHIMSQLTRVGIVALTVCVLGLGLARLAAADD